MAFYPNACLSATFPFAPLFGYGKATKRAWGDKPSTNTIKPIRTQMPGAIVSFDTMTSPTPGLIAQMTGAPTSRRY
jgi:hypothetical protein